jgi:DedD protein
MDETPTAEAAAASDDALKRRLLKRIAVAAVIVVGLLGSLAVFDTIYAPSPPAPAKLAELPPATEPPPPAAPPAEAKPEPAATAKAGQEAEPEGTASPGAPPLQPLPPETTAGRPLTRPASGRHASVRPTAPVPPATSPEARPEPARELAQPPVAARRAPASRPISDAAERQFALQVGVFGNLTNAEDLRAKLELHGIPASIEARVRVGPFKTREEVAAARAKLKELGLDDGLLVSVRK